VEKLLALLTMNVHLILATKENVLLATMEQVSVIVLLALLTLIV
jgi:hypothetical protein